MNATTAFVEATVFAIHPCNILATEFLLLQYCVGVNDIVLPIHIH